MRKAWAKISWQERLGRAGQGRAGQGGAGQGRVGQGRAGQGRAGHGSDRCSIVDTHPRLDPVLHLPRSIVRGVCAGVAVSIDYWCIWVEGGKLLYKDWVLGRTVEEDDEHHGGEAHCEGQLVFVHSCWCEPVKDAFTCTHNHTVRVCLVIHRSLIMGIVRCRMVSDTLRGLKRLHMPHETQARWKWPRSSATGSSAQEQINDYRAASTCSQQIQVLDLQLHTVIHL
jgi:hypothetical protein